MWVSEKKPIEKALVLLDLKDKNLAVDFLLR